MRLGTAGLEPRERLPAGDDDVAVAGAISIPALMRPVRSQAISVEPLPMKGSRTRAPASLLLLMARSINGRGFIVGWSGEVREL